MSSTLHLAGALAAVRETVEVLDRAVRAAGGLVPADVAARWAAFAARWRELGAALEAGVLDGARARRWVDAYAGQLGGWVELLAALGVTRGAAGATAGLGFDGFISPSRARARMDSVNAEVDTLDEHITARRAALGDAFVHAWTRWRDGWRRFYGGYPRTWDWWYLGNASAWNETLVYQQRLGDWRDAAERAGVRFTVPAPQRPPERGPGSDWLGSARDIAIAGAIGAAAFGAVYLVSKVT